MNNDSSYIQNLIQFLSSHLSAERLERIHYALNNRTRYMTLVLENMFQEHNASAVVRTAECFGVQDIHTIENLRVFKPTSTIAMGASKWLSFYQHTTTLNAYEALRQKGYYIVATSPSPQSYTPSTLPLNQPVALVFGTEGIGLSSDALAHADAFLYIPMYGLTQSFNVSVSAALCVSKIIERMREQALYWQLNEREYEQLLLEWLRAAVSGSAELEKRLLSMQL
ncbi:hypothetical protein J120_00570 [candidate division TM6 bacterium JCVI TM6SC1]|uniref:tRNA (guanosine(18)-2'-O)-methyltransferase n=1 Tax=candidate division TM6 bacterium JCVI TM6SC1 TaxID=1306947 RepID=A0A0D2K5D4_9BACT|nr:hypothetical protein J120_00570 [candidate division TM6 bacterium JCVI TM6SC1]